MQIITYSWYYTIFLYKGEQLETFHTKYKLDGEFLPGQRGNYLNEMSHFLEGLTNKTKMVTDREMANWHTHSLLLSYTPVQKRDAIAIASQNCT